MKHRPSIISRIARRRPPVGERVPVTSTAISAITYEPSAARLDVEFEKGTVYQYGCVTPETYKAFLDADSKGRFFVREIRGRHPYMKTV